jgi:hypothetical protein
VGYELKPFCSLGFSSVQDSALDRNFFPGSGLLCAWPGLAGVEQEGTQIKVEPVQFLMELTQPQRRPPRPPPTSFFGSMVSSGNRKY